MTSILYNDIPLKLLMKPQIIVGPKGVWLLPCIEFYVLKAVDGGQTSGYFGIEVH